MRVACLGGGPAGLYFGISMKLRDPAHEVVVIERNRANDTFGWGVVLSDDALSNLAQNDPISAEAIRSHFAYWDDIAVVHDGVRTVSGGHGFAGIGRKQMLILLQQRARELGVELRFETEFKSAEEYRKDYDLVVGADGINSRVRQEYAEVFKPDIELRACKFIWLGTHQKFDDAFTFIFEKTEHGWIWAHVYQFDADTATFIVECAQDTWENFGFEGMTKEEIVEKCREVFAAHLGAHELMSNANHLRGSAVWMNFPRVLCEKWHHENVVLLGDASATAHFSIGSGSRLAFDSAIALADYLHSEPTMEAAFERYQAERRLEVLRLQSAARNSLEWFEEVERYLDLDPVQFNYSLLTRSQRISHENLRLRDPEWLESAERWFQNTAGAAPDAPLRAPMFAPFRLRDMTLKNRIVVSPMAQYKAVDGCPTDWHLIHYGERAKGGAGLVYTEMTCVSPEGRITPGCPGLYAPEHEAAWKRLTDFVHAETDAKICCQIGHSGRKGSTCVPWDGGIDAPLAADNWETLAPSAIPYKPDNATPRAMDRADMDKVTAQFVAAARMADRAGADMIEVHAAHGYLLAGFISPITNRRTDEYGGSLENRARLPLRVAKAVRQAWPESLPLFVRISSTDWLEGGWDLEQSIQLSRWMKDLGVDLMDCSSGAVNAASSVPAAPGFHVPFATAIRKEAGIATGAVGLITEAVQAEQILGTGLADLIFIGRGFLEDPYWALHAARKLRAEGEWPMPYARAVGVKRRA